MENQYDIVVIGGGHNGLTAATWLAKKGKKVALFEKNENLGGLASGYEFHPGYRTNGLLQDTTGIRPWVVDQLELTKYGLIVQKQRPSYALLGSDGDGIWLSGDQNEAKESISALSEKDARAYLNYCDFIQKIRGFIHPLLNNQPPDLVDLGLSNILQLGRKAFGLKRLGNKTMTELLKVAPMCVADFLNEYFESELLKSGLLYPAIHGSFTGPWSSYTNLNLLMWECTASQHIPAGSQQLVDALTLAAQDVGVSLFTSTAVESIQLGKKKEVTGVVTSKGKIECHQVVSTCTPQVTFLDLIAPNYLDHPFEHDIVNYRSRGTTAIAHFALSEKVKFKYQTPEKITFARTCSDIDTMERAFDPVKYGEYARRPLLEISVPTDSSPNLAPEGCDVISVMAHFAPYHLKGGWNSERKTELLECISEELFKYTSTSSTAVVGQDVLTPKDLEEDFGLTGGQIFHGEHAVDQLLTRPVPKCANYQTPIEGLYLSGSGSFPGGGISCAPGALGAQKVLKMSK